MKVSVDHNLCQGHARCLTLAPEAFTFDEEADRASGRPSDELVNVDAERVRAAVRTCPEQAITMEE